MRIHQFYITITENEINDLFSTLVSNKSQIKSLRCTIGDNSLILNGQYQKGLTIPFTITFAIDFSNTEVILKILSIHALGGISGLFKNSFLQFIASHWNIKGLSVLDDNIYINVNAFLLDKGIQSECQVKEVKLSDQTIALNIIGEIHIANY